MSDARDAVTVLAPATSANLGSGFDVFGLCLAEPHHVVTVRRAPRLTIEMRGVDAERIPAEPERNVAGLVARALGCTAQVTVECGYRTESGLGSSAASAAGTAFALDLLYGLGKTRDELVWPAAQGEVAAAGEAHADNVAPALLGGFTVVHKDVVRRVCFPRGIGVVAVTPHIHVSTQEARAVLPKGVTLAQLVTSVGHAALLTLGMQRSDLRLVSHGMYPDAVEASRSRQVPGYQQVRQAALDAGAAGVTLSGSGPSLVALCPPETRGGVGRAMEAAFAAQGLDCDVYLTRPGRGVREVKPR